MSQSPAPPELIAKFNRQFKTPVLSENATWAHLHAAELCLQGALKGGVPAVREIADRIEGRSPQRTDLVAMERLEVTIKSVDDPPLQGREDERLIGQLDELIERSNDEETKQEASALALRLRQKVKGKIDGEST